MLRMLVTAQTHRNWATPDQYELYQRIILNFASFTEYSRSGKGFHIWVKGNIGKGRRREGVELYSQERFICLYR